MIINYIWQGTAQLFKRKGQGKQDFLIFTVVSGVIPASFLATLFRLEHRFQLFQISKKIIYTSGPGLLVRGRKGLLTCFCLSSFQVSELEFKLILSFFA